MAQTPRYPQLIFLGGLQAIGRNSTAIHYENDLLLIDAGLQFPEADMYGVERLIPNFDYIYQNESQLKGIVFTHAHEDHIGAAPFLLRRLHPTTIYGSPFTLAMLKQKLKKNGVSAKHHFQELRPGKRTSVGKVSIELVQVAHSVPDNMAVFVRTPKGNILHSSDFKIDHSPVDKRPTDLRRLAEIGSEGVDVLLADSTNATEEGMTVSERVVGETLNQVMSNAPSRIVMATFASNIHRIQQMLWAAKAHDRKVVVLGTSMADTLQLAQRMGYVELDPQMLVKPSDVGRHERHRLLLICTGSQGEPQSALSRLAQSDYQGLQIEQDDTVLLSADPIPGNELFVNRVVNACLRRGARVINELENVHVSGHGCREEQKMLLALIKPQHFIPIHGEYRMLAAHKASAVSLGMAAENIMIASNGDVVELQKNRLKVVKRIPADPLFVDGNSLAQPGDRVFVDRKNMAEQGLVSISALMNLETLTLVGEPVVLTRGCFYESEMDAQVKAVVAVLHESCRRIKKQGNLPVNQLRKRMQDELYAYLASALRRKPIVLLVLHGQN